MDAQVLLEAAEIYEKKAQEAEARGDADGVKENLALAARKYRQLAQLCPTRKNEFLSAAGQCDAGNIVRGAQTPAPLPTARPNREVQPQQNKTFSPYSVKAKDISGQISKKNKDYSGYGFKVSTPNDSVTFDKVIGLEDAKMTIRQDLIFPLKHPEIYQKHNLKIGANTLLYGPPGTGKTTFAKAVANDVDVPFINVNCNSLVDSYIGVTGKNVDNLFNEVRRFIAEQQTAVILFIDEIDAIAQSRGGENKTAQEAVPTLIKQLDGFDTDNSGIIIIAATNISHVLDKAVLDRFKSQIYIPLPDEEDREKIFELNLNERNINQEHLSKIDLNAVAKNSENLSGRKITQICDNFMRQLVEFELEGKSPEKSYTQMILDLIKKAR